MNEYETKMNDECILKISYGTNGLDIIKLTKEEMWQEWVRRDETLDSLRAENKELRERVDQLTAKLAGEELNRGDLLKENAKLKTKNTVLLDVVLTMFERKGRK